MRRLLFLPGVVLFLLGGCGYHLAGRGEVLPADVHTLHIRMFANKTYKPFLENEVTNAVTDQFLLGRHLQLLEDTAVADAVLSGDVAKYTTHAISYDRNDTILEYRASMTVDATLRHSRGGAVLWRGDVTWTETYPANQNKNIQQDNEAAAIGIICNRIADDLFSRIMDNF